MSTLWRRGGEFSLLSRSLGRWLTELWVQSEQGWLGERLVDVVGLIPSLFSHFLFR